MAGKPVTDQPRGDWMQTFTGRAFYPMDADALDLDITDISHALSMLCRYGGHTDRFYSVAEHCVLVSQVVDPEFALWGLLHDATEAYMGDLIRPLKRALPDYARWEDSLMALIAYKYGLCGFTMPAEIKYADTRILVNERQALLKPAPQAWAAIENMEPYPDIKIEAWSPEVARFEYMKRFEELTSA